MKTKSWQHKEPCDLFGEMILLGGWMEGVRLQDLNEITIMQVTGLKDKNGKEICEGDILRGENGVYVVGYDVDNVEFVCQNHHAYIHPEAWHKREIIGNVFDNPEFKDEDRAAGNQGAEPVQCLTDKGQNTGIAVGVDKL